MFIDSHCHLNMLDLSAFNGQLDEVLKQAESAGVERMLCVSVDIEHYPELKQIAEQYPNIWISFGIHPNSEMEHELDEQAIAKWADHPACIAIGETGLDYYRTEPGHAQDVQRERFRQHIRASKATKKPLIIHTRQAAEDTLKIMREEQAEQIGGVMHCFAEDLPVAEASIDLNFYISFSGIVTFKNASSLKEVAKAIPLERMLIETDSPYLAPVPFRGKQNHPALVSHVAEYIAELRGLSVEEVANTTKDNFYRCFRLS